MQTALKTKKPGKQAVSGLYVHIWDVSKTTVR